MTKQIKFERMTKDYSAYLNGQYIGSFGSHREAELELDRLAFEMLSHQHDVIRQRLMPII